MGMLIDFYTGDAKRIVDAWHREDADVLADARVVAAHADLSFHLGPEGLDHLVLTACELAARPPMTFAACVRGELSPDAESGIHELSDAFRDLLAEVPAEQAGQLYERWTEKLPEPPVPASEPRWRRRIDAIRDRVMSLVLGAVLLPMLAGAWLFSRRFREERRRNRATLAARAKEVEAAGKSETLRDAVAKLMETCRTAKARGKKVLYAWSL